MLPSDGGWLRSDVESALTALPSMSPEKQHRKIIIVCAQSEESNVRSSLADLIHASSEREDIVAIVAIANEFCRNEVFVTAEIEKHFSVYVPHLLVPSQITINSKTLSSKAYLLRPSGIRSLLRRDLPILLQSLHLDWISHLDNILRNGWHHGLLDRSHIEQWIQQFEHCGSHRWVAEAILKSLDFWSDTRTREALRILPEAGMRFDSICINRHVKAGKSADVIANLVRKQLESIASLANVPLLDFREALTSTYINNILYVEDCILSGNEMERTFRGLLGLPDPYGAAKATPLDNPMLLKNKQVVLRFAVVGNGGREHIRQFLLKHDLTGIQLDEETSSIVPMLTVKGLEELIAGTLYNEEDRLRNPDEQMQQNIFHFWPAPDKQKRAKQFCAQIGRQLYACYLQSHNKQKSEQWIEECALGVRSAALTLAFAHSIPKETLPLLWAEGMIRWNDKPFYWTPLFTGAG